MGQKIGRYEILRLISKSNDAVYEAYDPMLNRRVAVKVLSIDPDFTELQRQERIHRFQREARVTGQLRHEGIMAIYDFGEEQSAGYYHILELVNGHSLFDSISLGQIYTLDVAYPILASILGALEYAHSAGVIHRDLKPPNVIVLPDGRAKVIDFGIACSTFEPSITGAGPLPGTLSYMSPEQVSHKGGPGAGIDHRSDLFSVGVIAFEMFTGARPFRGHTPNEIGMAIMNASPTYPSLISPDIRCFINRALEKDPSDRYASASEMLQALHALPKGTVSPSVQSRPIALVQNPNQILLTPGANPVFQGRGSPSPRVSSSNPPGTYGDIDYRKWIVWCGVALAALALWSTTLTGKRTSSTAPTPVRSEVAGAHSTSPQKPRSAGLNPVRIHRKRSRRESVQPVSVTPHHDPSDSDRKRGSQAHLEIPTGRSSGDGQEDTPAPLHPDSRLGGSDNDSDSTAPQGGLRGDSVLGGND